MNRIIAWIVVLGASIAACGIPTVQAQIAFEAGNLYPGVGEIRHAPGAAEVSSEAEKLAALREVAASTRTATLAEGIQQEALNGLKLLEEIDPQAAIDIYTSSGKHAEEIGRQIQVFSTSKSEFQERTLVRQDKKR